MPADPPSPLNSLLLFLEYGGVLSMGAFTSVDGWAGAVVVGVRAECRNPFNDEPAVSLDVVPTPRKGSPTPLAGSVFATLCKAAGEAAQAAEIAAWEEAVERVAGEIEGAAAVDEGDSDETDDESEQWTITGDDEEADGDFRTEGEAADDDDEGNAPLADAGESLADLSTEMAEWTDRPREEVARSPGQGEEDAATLYDFLKAAGRITIRIGTTPEELYFPYVSVVASGKPIGEGERRAAVIDPAQLRWSGDPAAELMAAVARAIRGVAGERVN